jgi:thioredoxin reductase
MARAYNQAQKFGAEMAIPDEAISLAGDRPVGPFTLDLRIGERVKARSVVLATGALPAARCREPRCVRSDKRSLLGVADRSEVVR